MLTEKGLTLGLYNSHGSLGVKETYRKDTGQGIKFRVKQKNQGQGKIGAGTSSNQNINWDLPVGNNQGLGTNSFFRVEERT